MTILILVFFRLLAAMGVEGIKSLAHTPEEVLAERNTVAPLVAKEKQEQTTTETDQQEQTKQKIGMMFHALQSTKKQDIPEFLEKNSQDIESFIGSPEYQKWLRDARKNYNSSNKELATQANFALQIYAKYELNDKNIKVDGIAGSQTLTVLRLMQSQGIGGEPVSINMDSLTVEQRQKIAEYTSKIDENKLKRSVVVAPSVIGQANNSTEVPKPITSKESTILANNTSIQSTINNVQPADDQRLNKENISILDRSEIIQAVSDIITNNPALIETYTTYLENNKQGDTTNIDDAIVSRIEEKLASIKQSKNSELVRIPVTESYMACIQGFESLLKNFSSSEDQTKMRREKLETQASSTFTEQILSLDVRIDGEMIRFVYDMEKGEIRSNILIHKDKEGKLTTDRQGMMQEVVTNIQPRKELETKMQESVLGRITQDKVRDIIDLQDTATTMKADFIDSMMDYKDLISHSIESNLICRNVLGWIGEFGNDNTIRKEHAKDSDLYKTFDIIYRSINKYSNLQDIRKLREKLSKIQALSQQYMKETPPQDAWTSYLGREKIQAHINGNEGQFGIYMLLASCTHDVTPSNNLYSVIDMQKMEKIITHNDTHGGGFGQITHRRILDQMDTRTSKADAAALLEEIHMT